MACAGRMLRRWWVTPTAHQTTMHRSSTAIRRAPPTSWNCAIRGDGAKWWRVVQLWDRIKGALLDALFSPFPPIRAPIQLLRTLGTAEALRFARLLMLPATVMGQELFSGDAARLLLLGNALHADVPIDAPGSGVMGFLMTMLAQDCGFPVPVGGAGALTAAMVKRASAAGAQLECGRRVDAIEIRGGRAVAVHSADGGTVRVRRAVVADVAAPDLYEHLLPRDALPARLFADLEHFIWDTPVVKVNYALDAPIPWRSTNLRRAGTVHLGADAHGLVRWMADLNTATVPDNPFLLLGQMSTADPSRSPEGTESAWAYTHLPRDRNDDESADRSQPSGGSGDRGARPRLCRPHRRTDGAAALRSAVHRCQPVRRSNQRWHRSAAAAAHLSAVPRVWDGGDADLQCVSRECVCAPRRQCARGLRTQRRAGGTEVRRLSGMAATQDPSDRHLPIRQVTDGQRKNAADGRRF